MGSSALDVGNMLICFGGVILAVVVLIGLSIVETERRMKQETIADRKRYRAAPMAETVVLQRVVFNMEDTQILPSMNKLFAELDMQEGMAYVEGLEHRLLREEQWGSTGVQNTLVSHRLATPVTSLTAATTRAGTRERAVSVRF